jgi:hypothetical protein
MNRRGRVHRSAIIVFDGWVAELLAQSRPIPKVLHNGGARAPAYGAGWSLPQSP